MFRDTIVVAIGTAMSRLTGLLRVMVFGIIVGQTALADAFDGANNSPNSIYELLVGGLLAASLVPMFTRFAEDDDVESAQTVVSSSLFILVVATVLAIALAPLVFGLYSLQPSALVDADEFRAAGTMMARICLIQIFFYGLSAIGSALLNARRHFFAAAWSPVLSNVITITLLLIIPFTRDGTPDLADISYGSSFFWLLTLSATGGVTAMGLVLVPALRRAQIPFRFGFTPNFGHPAVRQMVRLSSWTFGYVVTNQVALVVIKNLAEPGSGNQDAYSKAFIFFMLPHGLLAISIATTFVPELVRRVRAGDGEGFANWTTSGIRWIALLTIPSSVGIWVLARPIITSLLEYGNFTSVASENTARALMGFSVGLLGFSLYIFCLRGFYAHEDTRTPFLVNLFQNAVNIVLALVLVERHGVLGLGLAFGLSYLIASIVVLALLHQQFHAVRWLAMVSSLWRVVTASGVMGLGLWRVETLLEPQSGLSRLAELFLTVGGGVVAYTVLLLILRVPEISDLRSLLPRRGTDVGRPLE